MASVVFFGFENFALHRLRVMFLTVRDFPPAVVHIAFDIFTARLLRRVHTVHESVFSHVVCTGCREACGLQRPRVLCQPQHQDDAVGRSTNARVRQNHAFICLY